MMQLWVKVIPSSSRFSVELKQNEIVIHATEQPEKGKVNTEIAKELRKILGFEVRILRGLTSRKKLLEIAGEKQEILDMIENEVKKEK